MRPIDITVSNWDPPWKSRRKPTRQPAVRLGLALVRGMQPGSGRAHRGRPRHPPFTDVTDLARRAGLDRGDLQVLAAVERPGALAGNRREALWQAVGAVPDKDLLRPTTPDEEAPVLAAPSEGEGIVGDYRSHGLTLGRHPLALLRAPLSSSVSCRPKC